MNTLSTRVRLGLVALCLALVAAAVAVVAGAGGRIRGTTEATAIVATAPLSAGAGTGTTTAGAGSGSGAGSSAGSGSGVASTTTATTRPGSTASAAAPAASPYSGATPIGPVALTGCPPTTPTPPASPPWHPTVLVPESELPTPPPPAPRVTNVSVLSGKGMWIYVQSQTDGGNVGDIVAQAVADGLHQVWVRMGSSADGFYGQTFLDALVPAMHRHGIAVIGWGFPYLYDPAGVDLNWTLEALAWKAPTGDRLDGWGADIETAGDGTALSGKRASTYLGLVRAHMDGRPLVAIVYPPTAYWLANYPYQAMAPYIDAFAPMLYWNCNEPGSWVTMALNALSSLAPVHVIGQAWDMGPEGGRNGSPSGAEIARFLDVARRSGAVGASFWVWQDMTQEEWAYLAGYDWALAPTPPPRAKGA